MTVRLRAHHLLCLLTFAGRGYSPSFTENLRAVAGRIGRGASVLIVRGPDDICAPLLREQQAPHCRRDSVLRRDAAAAREVSRLLQTPAMPGTRLTLDRLTLDRMRAAFRGRTAPRPGVAFRTGTVLPTGTAPRKAQPSTRTVRSACTGCEWASFCTAIAAGGYAGTRLHPPTVQPQPFSGSNVSATPFMQ